MCRKISRPGSKFACPPCGLVSQITVPCLEGLRYTNDPKKGQHLDNHHVFLLCQEDDVCVMPAIDEELLPQISTFM